MIGSVSASDSNSTDEIIKAPKKNLTFTDLQKKIDSCKNNSEINLTGYYKYDNSDSLINGVAISKNIKIRGHDCVIDGSNLARCINITSNNHVILENITIINAYTDSENGAGIHADDYVNLKVINCVFKNNYIYNHNGGAISTNESCNVEIINCYFENNTSVRESDLEWKEFKQGMGSALYHKLNSTVALIDSIFKSNNAYLSTILVVSYDDIEVKKSRTYVRNCLFDNNTSFRCGVIYVDEYGDGEILDSTFTNNHSPGSTGVLKLDTCSYSLVKNCKFINNTGVDGAAICIERFTKQDVCHAQIINCEFKNNYASDRGGAILAIGGIVNIDNCVFENNSALEKGGAIYFKHGSFQMSNTKLIKNKAKNGAALYFYGDNSLIKSCTFISNTAHEKGAAIYLKEYVLLDKCTYSKNSGPKDKNGYGIYNAFKIKGKISAKNIKTKYKSGKLLKITLKNSKKQPVIGVKIKILVKTGKKTKSYYVTTNTKGAAKFKASLLSGGSHKVKITPEKCVKAKKTIKIKIAKAKANVKVSKKAKITLTDAKTKKALSKVKAQIKVKNGKTITKKTNKKGQINLNLKKGKHTLTITSKDNNYKFNKKITVKCN